MNLQLCVALLCASLGQAPSLDGGVRAAAESWFAEDKFKHFVTSYVATVMAGAGARLLGAEAGTAVWIGVGVGFGTGVAKEIHDLRNPEGHPSVRDLVWNAAGAGVGGWCWGRGGDVRGGRAHRRIWMIARFRTILLTSGSRRII